MRENSYWKRHWRLLMGGLIVVLLATVGGGIILVHARAQVPLGRACGEITLPEGGQLHYAVAYQGGMARQVEQCFVQAYRQCQNASMSVTWMEVDTGTDETLTVVPQNNQCQIISASQPYGVGIHTPQITTDTCQGLTLTSDTLVVKRCGNGDVIIPRTEFCGTVYHYNKAERNRQIEDCFVQDKQQCYPAELTSEPSSSAPPYQFEIDGACQLIWKASIDTPAVTCTGMIQQMDGLHFQSCGSSGEILAPVNP